MPGSILGNRVLRKEDPKFLTVGGKYVDDLADEPRLANAAFVTYVRSSVAHGTITGIDTSAALAMPGVIAVLTAADLGVAGGAGRVQPRRHPRQPGHRQGALRRRADRGRRQRDPPARARTPPSR